jgi:hypothetical protein
MSSSILCKICPYKYSITIDIKRRNIMSYIRIGSIDRRFITVHENTKVLIKDRDDDNSKEKFVLAKDLHVGKYSTIYVAPNKDKYIRTIRTLEASNNSPDTNTTEHIKENYYRIVNNDGTFGILTELDAN